MDAKKPIMTKTSVFDNDTTIEIVRALHRSLATHPVERPLLFKDKKEAENFIEKRIEPKTFKKGRVMKKIRSCIARAHQQMKLASLEAERLSLYNKPSLVGDAPTQHQLDEIIQIADSFVEPKPT